MEDDINSILKCFNGKNLYDILGLNRGENSHEIIKKQYKTLIKILHPDKNNQETVDSNKFDEVKKASLILLNKELKTLYDKKLSEESNLYRNMKNNDDFYYDETSYYKDILLKKERENQNTFNQSSKTDNNKINLNSFLFKKRLNDNHNLNSNLPFLSIDEIKKKSYLKKINSMIKNGVKLSLSSNALSSYYIDIQFLCNLFGFLGKVIDIRYEKTNDFKACLGNDIFIEFLNDKSADFLIKIFEICKDEVKLIKFLGEKNLQYSDLILVFLVIGQCERILEKDLVNLVNKDNYNQIIK